MLKKKSRSDASSLVQYARLEASGLLSGHKLGVVDESVPVLVVHVQNRVNHVGQLLVREQLGRAVRCWLLATLVSQVLALFHVPVD